jgi:hypothetical protein
MGVVLAWIALAGCGHGAIDLTIEALGPDGPLRVPEDVDRVDVAVRRADTQEPLLEKRYDLDPARQSFPLSLRMTQGDRTGDEVLIAVTAFLQEARVGDATARVRIQPQEVTSVTLRLQP